MLYVSQITFGSWGDDVDLDECRLRGILEYFSQINALIFARYPQLPGVYDGRRLRMVRYKFVPADGRPDSDHEFTDVLGLYARGFGPCKVVAPARCGELRARHGMDAAVCDFTKRRVNGRDEYHTYVRRPDGLIDDPSPVLGMG